VPPELEGIISYSLADCLNQTFGKGGSFARTLTVRCNDESIMVPALSQVVALYPQVYIKSLARVLGGVPELDILFTITGGDAEERKTLVDSALEQLRQGLTTLGIAHWEKDRAGDSF
jgi:nicotinamide-nucleotide amidase